MAEDRTHISVKGKQVAVPSVTVDNFEVVATGSWLKRASVKGEDYVQGNPSTNPERLLAGIKSQGLKADIFSFSQRIPNNSPMFPYPMQWDNIAALPIVGYAEWWEKRLSQDTRRNVRLATKRGLAVRPASYTDEFVSGIKGIYDETQFRQGRRFWHYGKDFETVKRENGTFLDKSEFIGAYCGTEMVGFLKMVYVERYASIMQILSMTAHYDKRPMNALMAKAVEICNEKGVSHLLYRKYAYHKSHPDSLAEFKRRNGFERIDIPRYYVPLTLKGRLAIMLKLHLGASEILPTFMVNAWLKLRNKHYERKSQGNTAPTTKIVTAERPRGAD